MIKVKDLLKLFHGEEYEIFCERRENLYGYEVLFSSFFPFQDAGNLADFEVVYFGFQEDILVIKVPEEAYGMFIGKNTNYSPEMGLGGYYDIPPSVPCDK